MMHTRGSLDLDGPRNLLSVAHIQEVEIRDPFVMLLPHSYHKPILKTSSEELIESF